MLCRDPKIISLRDTVTLLSQASSRQKEAIALVLLMGTEEKRGGLRQAAANPIKDEKSDRSFLREEKKNILFILMRDPTVPFTILELRHPSVDDLYALQNYPSMNYPTDLFSKMCF